MHLGFGIEVSDGFRRPQVLLVGKKVCLVDQDHRLGPATADDREIPLHPAEVEIRTRIGDHDHDLNIGGDYLFLGAPP